MNWEAEHEFYENPMLDPDGFHYGKDWKLLTNFQKSETSIYNILHSQHPNDTKIHPSAYEASGKPLPTHKAFLIKNGVMVEPIWEALAKIKRKNKNK